MKNSKCHLITDYSNKIRKRFVQRLIYNMSHVRGNMLILCGPALKAHVNDSKIILRMKDAICYIYELNTETYLQNVKDMKKITTKYKFKIINADVLNAKIRRFIDLDFCNLLTDTILTVSTIYFKMKALPFNYNKHLIVTFTNRGAKLNSDIQLLCNTYNISNKFEKNKCFPGLNMYTHVDNSVDAFYITYRDGQPMTSFSYQWK